MSFPSESQLKLTKFGLITLFTLILVQCNRTDHTPCELEFHYSISDIDSGFGLTDVQVRQAVENAINLWSDAIDTIHAEKSPDANIAIRFVFDERQAGTNRAMQLEENLDIRRQRIDRMRADLLNAERRLQSRAEEHERLIMRINTHVESLNNFIEERNRAGGLNPAEVDRVESERAALNELQSQERQMRSGLQQKIEVNQRMLDELNREINFSNELADRFNEEVGPSRYFAGGNFERIGNEGTITIYHFANERELSLVLAHEVGHALGLSHVENSFSVMYRMIGAQLTRPELRLTDEDIAEIRDVARCAE
ncbi:MAG: matrixin family metalloprotease [Balneolia bacterium]|nr:matrixin family metalloprotease [Balneolia bacterium]